LIFVFKFKFNEKYINSFNGELLYMIKLLTLINNDFLLYHNSDFVFPCKISVHNNTP